MLDAPAITVVVPTRDRPAALRRCLEALAGDPTAPPHEVVVVDDATHGPAPGSGWPPHVRVAATHGRGPAAARNVGARAARARLVAFTDDDCVPQRGWLAALVEALGDADVVGGTTRNALPANAPAEAAQRLADALQEAWNTTPFGPQFFPTNNVGCRAAVLAGTPFDERFPTSAGEDRDWCARIVAGGHRLSVAPAAVVLHHGPAGVGRFLRQQWRYGSGAWAARGGDGPAAVRVRSPVFYARVVASARRAPTRRVAVAGLLAASQVAAAGGLAQAAVLSRAPGRA